MSVAGLDHVQVAAPTGCEKDDALADARRFYSEDPWGNRIELLANVEL
jgi:hypothetical protein